MNDSYYSHRMRENSRQVQSPVIRPLGLMKWAYILLLLLTLIFYFLFVLGLMQNL